MTYFDFNATTPLHPAARAAMREAEEEFWHNPSSPYRASAAAHARLKRARGELAELLDVRPDRLVFNSGATEGNNGVFRWVQSALPPASKVAISAVEHPCVIEPARFLLGDRLSVLPVNRSGVLEASTLEAHLEDAQPALVSVMAANNETGVEQPWRELAARCRGAGVLFHSDAAQWLGKRPSEGLGDCEFLTGCAHKFGGPRGVGFLLLPSQLGGFQAQLGGAQEHGLRGGTENLPGIVGMVAALKAVLGESCIRQAAHRDCFETALSKAISGLEVIGCEASRLPNTSLLIMPRFKNTRWVTQLDRRGYQVSTGAACATGKEGPSAVLGAMGLSPNDMSRAIRVSSGWQTLKESWTGLATAMIDTYAALMAENQAGNSQVIEMP